MDLKLTIRYVFLRNAILNRIVRTFIFFCYAITFASNNEKTSLKKEDFETSINRTISKKRAFHGNFQLQIKGKVVDSNGQPIPGANIIEKGKTTGTQSDLDGNFSIAVTDKKAILVVSYLGFVTKEIEASNKNMLHIVLIENANSLNEVVIVGYGAIAKEEVTSAVVQIKSTDFKAGVTNSAVELIKGKVAGLSVINQAGSDPNATPQVNLRGIGTISANNEPLVIIDGMYGTISDLNLLNPGDIVSFSVLKDASSTAIYGTRGSNGVIIIKSKQGERDSSAIEYSSTIFTERPRRNPKLLDSEQYISVMRQLGYKRADIDKGNNTKWIDELIEENISSYHSLSFSKGSKNSTMRVSIGYKDSKGIISNTSNNTTNIKLNFNNQLYDWLKIDGTIGASLARQRFTNYSALDEAIKYDPTAPVYNADGKFYELPGVGASNPVALLQQVENSGLSNNWNASLNATIDFSSNLSLSIRGTSFLRGFEGSFFEDIDSRKSVLTGVLGSAAKENTSSIENNLESLVNYKASFNDHSIKILGGYSFIDRTSTRSFIANSGFLTNKLKYNDIGSGSFLQEGRAEVGSFKDKSQLIAFFGRLNYSYKGIYLLNASVRKEGSSVFGDNYKWGLFPAISGAWRIKNEDFLRKSFFSDLKIRGGYGITGRSQGIPLYQSLARIGDSGRALYNGEWIQTFGPINNPNPDLRWEKTKEINFGLDYGIFNDRITGTIDLYSRKTEDLLGSFNTQTPPSLEPLLFTNVGTIRNNGVELALNALAVKTNAFSWSIGATYSNNKNEVVSLANDQFKADRIFYGDYGNVAASLYLLDEGLSLGTFYGFKFKGFDSNGKWQFEDINKDGKIEENSDYTTLGSGLPMHLFSITSKFEYKDFDFSVNFVGAAGFKVFNEKRLWYENTANSPSNYMTSILQEPNSSLHDRLRFSDYYLEDGDYVRLDNLTLGYNLPHFSNLGWLKGARIYFTATNLALFTKYSGIDPEVGSGTGDGLAMGWDKRSFYPRSSTYLLGFNFKL